MLNCALFIFKELRWLIFKNKIKDLDIFHPVAPA